MRVRLQFEKKGNIRFIGHLDMLRYFQKAIRRAELPIKYSEGYHPHQLLSFAMPLGVGVESEGEYLDMELPDGEVKEADDHFLQDLKDRLNEEMASGVLVLSAKVVPKTEKNAMAAVAAASYEVWYEEKGISSLKAQGYDLEKLTEALRCFYEEAEHITVIKKTKKSEKEVDLKPLIFELSIKRKETEEKEIPDGHKAPEFSFLMLVSAGSENNVKPQLVMEAFHRFLQLSGEAPAIRILRKDLYRKTENGEFISL